MRLIIGIGCLLLLAAGSAWADVDRIGIYADPEGQVSELTIPPGETVWAYLLACLPSYPEGIWATEFHVENWPGSPGEPYGVAAVNWAMELVIGEMGDDCIALGLHEDLGIPDENGVVLLATIQFFALSPDWLRNDLEISIVTTLCWDYGCDEGPVIVLREDDTYDAFCIAGDTFVINPTGGADAIAVMEGTFSQLKALY